MHTQTNLIQEGYNTKQSMLNKKQQLYLNCFSPKNAMQNTGEMRVGVKQKGSADNKTKSFRKSSKIHKTAIILSKERDKESKKTFNEDSMISSTGLGIQLVGESIYKQNQQAVRVPGV